VNIWYYLAHFWRHCQPNGEIIEPRLPALSQNVIPYGKFRIEAALQQCLSENLFALAVEPLLFRSISSKVAGFWSTASISTWSIRVWLRPRNVVAHRAIEQHVRSVIGWIFEQRQDDVGISRGTLHVRGAVRCAVQHNVAEGINIEKFIDERRGKGRARATRAVAVIAGCIVTPEAVIRSRVHLSVHDAIELAGW
jgi:hypothetical protein